VISSVIPVHYLSQRLFEGPIIPTGVSKEPTRFFEAAEAEALLPELDRLLASAQDLLARLEQARGQVAQATRANGHVTGNGSSAGAPVDEAQSIQQHLHDILRQIDSQGVIVRDIQAGLIDFPAVRDGQPIYLCWRRGEPLRIEWWHPTSTGIAGRQRL
jgi:hypothetical protein